MPLYEYHCSKCEKTFEVMRKFSDPPLTEHEGCGGTLERLLSAPAFQLKGTGWYVTDYAKSGAKPAPSSKSESGDTKTADSKTSDSKAGDSKAAESKSTENKGESKIESKPAPTTHKGD
jgi:putative FmdB family regulatory protein